jgi:hypothetical protein
MAMIGMHSKIRETVAGEREKRRECLGRISEGIEDLVEWCQGVKRLTRRGKGKWACHRLREFAFFECYSQIDAHF